MNSRSTDANSSYGMLSNVRLAGSVIAPSLTVRIVDAPRPTCAIKKLGMTVENALKETVFSEFRLQKYIHILSIPICS